MHVVTILRYYLGMTQMELAEKSGVSFVDVNEIENKPINGLIDKYCRLAECLHVPVHTIVMNDVLGVPETFFDQERNAKYRIPRSHKTGVWDVWGRSGYFGKSKSALLKSIQHLRNW